MKIFLGYASERLEAAREIYEFLNASAEDTVWFDKRALTGGDDWDAERLNAQRDADLVVHLYSHEIQERPGVVNREIRESLRLVEDQPLESLYLIVVRLDPVHVPVQLLRFQYVDHFDHGWRESLARSLEKRRNQLAKRTTRTTPAISSADGSTQKIEEARMPDCRKILIEDVSDTYECRGDYLCYASDGIYWDYVNSAIATHAIEGFFSSRFDFRTYWSDPVYPVESDMKSEWSIGTEEFFKSEDLLSLRFYTYIGYSGAAHPNHHVSTLNFLGENVGAVDIKQLLGQSSAAARHILEYCEKVIMAGFDSATADGNESFFENYKSEEEDVWRLLAHYNFDRRGLTFNFSPYDILPYVFGVHEAFVPWSIVREAVQSEDPKLINVIAGTA